MWHPPGSIGIVIYDRKNGATWQNVNADVAYPAASTMKLAMMTDILLRSDAGSIADQRRPAGDVPGRYTSNDDDATYPRDKYEDGKLPNLIRGVRDGRCRRVHLVGAQLGLHVLHSPGPGQPDQFQRAQKETRRERPRLPGPPAPARERARPAVGRGWGAGPQNHPGNKDGWEQDGDLWITNTVGFACQGQEYTISLVMYNLEGFRGVGDAGFKYGSNKLTQIASILFQGHHTAAPTPQASAVP